MRSFEIETIRELLALLAKLKKHGAQTSSRALVLCAEIRQMIQNCILKSRKTPGWTNSCQNRPPRFPKTNREKISQSRPQTRSDQLNGWLHGGVTASPIESVSTCLGTSKKLDLFALSLMHSCLGIPARGTGNKSQSTHAACCLAD